MNKIKQLIQNFKIQPIYIAVIPILLAIIGMIVLISLTNKRDQEIEHNEAISPTNYIQQEVQRYSSVTVDSSVPGSQFIFNDKLYYTPTKIEKIPEGTYTLTAHNAGYEDTDIDVTVQSDKVNTVEIPMVSQKMDYGVLDEEGTVIKQEGVRMQEEIAQREKNYPLTVYLPEVIGNVMLDYDVNSDGSVKYVVRALPNKAYSIEQYKQAVENFILSKGYDPKKIQITWK